MTKETLVHSSTLSIYISYNVTEDLWEGNSKESNIDPQVRITNRNENKFSFLKEGYPSSKTARALCMLGTPPNLVIVYTALKPRHRRTSTIVSESASKILNWQNKKHKQLSKAAPSAIH